MWCVHGTRAGNGRGRFGWMGTRRLLGSTTVGIGLLVLALGLSLVRGPLFVGRHLAKQEERVRGLRSRGNHSFIIFTRRCADVTARDDNWCG